MSTLKEICSGLPVDPLPEYSGSRQCDVPHAPVRTTGLDVKGKKVNTKESQAMFFG